MGPRGPAVKLQGKVALITGASGGMGRATALEFAREGAAAVGLQYHRSKSRAEEVAKEVKSLSAIPKVLRADTGRQSDVAAMVRRMVGGFHRLDILTCFAGHPFRREDWFAPFDALTPEQLQAPLTTDLLGTFYTCQAALPHLIKSKGRVVLIGSTPAITGDTVGISYLMAKAAVLALTRSLALLAGPKGVHVNAIAPGSIATEAMARLTRAEEAELRKASALRRFGTAEEVARKAVFLASADSDFLTGQTLVVDGGYALW